MAFASLSSFFFKLLKSSLLKVSFPKIIVSFSSDSNLAVWQKDLLILSFFLNREGASGTLPFDLII